MWIASAEHLDGSNVECIWLQRCWCQSAGDGDACELLVAQKLPVLALLLSSAAI